MSDCPPQKMKRSRRTQGCLTDKRNEERRQWEGVINEQGRRRKTSTAERRKEKKVRKSGTYYR